MRKIAHISDLHFGREDPLAVEALIDELNQNKPDLVVVSGDLTQRARTKQFIAAAKFMKDIKFPQIVIPGNHDLIIYNIFNRIFNPLKKYRKYISLKDHPTFIDEEIAVVGINTARSGRWEAGKIRKDDIEYISETFENIENKKLKALVIHHNFISQPKKRLKKAVKRSSKLIERMKTNEIDIILAGHVHDAYTDHIKNHTDSETSTLIVSAGTAISERTRGSVPNSYNWLEIDDNKLRIDIKYMINQEFKVDQSKEYLKEDNKWTFLK